MLCRVLQGLISFFNCGKEAEPGTDAGSVWFEFISSGKNVLRGVVVDINFQGQSQEAVKAVFKDAQGNETTAHGVVTFASSDESIATVQVQEDGVTAIVTGTGKVGVATITATDAQDNAAAIANVTTSAGEATSMDLQEVLTDSAAGGQAPAPTGDAPVDSASDAPAASDASAPVDGSAPAAA